MSVSQHFVTFMSPGSFMAESSTLPIDGWDIDKAQTMAADITERHGARPYAFRFTTRSRGPDDLDSKVSATSPTYYIGCKVEDVEDVERRANPAESILLSNMKCNGWDRIAVTTTGWKWSQPLQDGDVVLPPAPTHHAHPANRGL